MQRISIVVLTLSLLVLACGSDDVTVSTAAEDKADSAAVPTDVPADEEPVIDGEGPLGGGPYPIGTLDFVVTNRSTGEQTAMYTLSCLGDTATLAGDWAPTHGGGLGAVEGDMCLRLADAAVQSRLINGAPDQACIQVYGGPDFAEVTGELDGQPVNTTFGRTDGCGISEWESLMAGLLPDPTSNAPTPGN